jgi:hypothetical protein
MWKFNKPASAKIKIFVFLTCYLSHFLVFGGGTLDFNLLNPSRGIGESFSDGVRERQERDRRRLEIETLKLENQQKKFELDQQVEAQRRKNKPISQASNSEVDEWLKAAAPRMGLYPDFEKVVFAADLQITSDMIRLMTPSTLAADIAYYLGTHKIEALAISKMNLIEAARSIDRIETKLKSSKLP